MSLLIQRIRTAGNRVRPASVRVWPYDPDLPQNVPTAALPSNWNATADHSPANGTALQALFDDFGGTLNAGDVISLDADVDYGAIVIPPEVKGDANNWIIVRSDEYASLPAFGSRATVGDATYMATISKAPTQAVHPALEIQAGDGVQGASYIRFIGIQFKATGTGYAGTNYIGPIAVNYVGTPPTDTTELPQAIGFDRCIITVDDDVHPWENSFNCIDSFVVGCHLYNYWGGGNDGSNAFRCYTGGRLLFDNNYLQCRGAGLFLGDNPLCVVRDVTYTNNYYISPSAWDDGGHGVNKGSFETKVGLRILIANNVFDGQYGGASGFATLTLKAEGEGGPKATTHVTVRGNKITNCDFALALLVGGSSDASDVGPNADWLIEHNLAYGIDSGAVKIDPYDNTGGEPFRRLQILNNTWLGYVVTNNYQTGYSMEDGSTPGELLIFRDNVIYGTYAVNNGFPGAQAFNWGWGANYVATHNLFDGTTYDANYYDNDVTRVPLGTLTNNNFPATLAAYGFTDDENDDYSIDNGSDYATASSTGGKPGYDSATYDSVWAGVEP